MLNIETLEQRDDGLYEEPDGEFLEVINRKRDRLRVLTRTSSESDTEEAADTDTVYECGASLSSGGDCSREVDNADATCFQH